MFIPFKSRNDWWFVSGNRFGSISITDLANDVGLKKNICIQTSSGAHVCHQEIENFETEQNTLVFWELRMIGEHHTAAHNLKLAHRGINQTTSSYISTSIDEWNWKHFWIFRYILLEPLQHSNNFEKKWREMS